MKSTLTSDKLKPELLTDMYLAFLDSFSDYAIPFKLTKEQFVKKFVQRLKISFELSCGVYREGGGLAAFIFTTVNEYKNARTAYNGGTGVRPQYRGQRLVSSMYEYLIPVFKENSIEQSILEVLTTNDKAIKAYEAVGFEKCDLFKCYKLITPVNRQLASAVSFMNVSSPQWTTYSSFADHSASFLDAETMIIQDLQNKSIIEARKEDRCIGYIIYQPAFGRINQIGIDPDYRNQKIATSLVQKVYNESENQTLTVLNISEKNIALHNFFKSLGFLNELDQYEMVLKL